MGLHLGWKAAGVGGDRPPETAGLACIRSPLLLDNAGQQIRLYRGTQGSPRGLGRPSPSFPVLLRLPSVSGLAAESRPGLDSRATASLI